MYDDRTDATEKKPLGLAPSTVWRWLLLLYEMKDAFYVAATWIRNERPDLLQRLDLQCVPSQKYRSRHRRDMLQHTLRMLAISRVYAKLFGKGIFPRYETPQGWS